MSAEYTLIYLCYGESIEECFETLDAALTRSAEMLSRERGCPRSIRRANVVVFDQESLFTDWLRSLQL